jgi:hypothetical protein
MVSSRVEPLRHTYKGTLLFGAAISAVVLEETNAFNAFGYSYELRYGRFDEEAPVKVMDDLVAQLNQILPFSQAFTGKRHAAAAARKWTRW